MNQTYTIKNFRVFDEQGATFEMAPVTILTGCNSSGKSSVTKSLMLLKSSMRKIKEEIQKGTFGGFNGTGFASCDVDFTRGNHKLGSFDHVLNWNSKKKEFSISYPMFSWAFQKNLDVCITFGKKNIDDDFSLRAQIEKVEISCEGKPFYKYLLSNSKNGENSTTERGIAHVDMGTWKHDLIIGLLNLENGCLCRRIFDDEKVDREGYGYATTFHEGDWESAQSFFGGQNAKILYFVHEKLMNRVPHHTKLLCEKFKIDDNIKRKDDTNYGEIDWENSEDTFKFPHYHLLPLYGLMDELDTVSKDTIVDFAKKRFVDEHQGDWYNTPGYQECIHNIFTEYVDSSFEKFSDFYTYYEDAYFKNEFVYFGTECEGYRIHSEGHIGLTSGTACERQKFSQKEFDVNWSDLKDNQKFHQIFWCLQGFGGYQDRAAYGGPDMSFPLVDVIREFAILVCAEALASCDLLSEAEFIEINRANTQRIYSFSEQGTEFNSLLDEYNNLPKIIKYTTDFYRYKFSSQDKEKHMHESIFDLVGRNYEKGEFVNKWLKELIGCEGVDIVPASEGVGYYVYLLKELPSGDIKRLALADLGFGTTPLVSMLLRIELIMCRYMSRPEQVTICIEEPESNLHPCLQSQLADVFADAVKRSDGQVNFVLETHSEYLVRKTQVLVAKMAKEEVWREQDIDEKCPFKVYYLSRPEDARPPYDMCYQLNGKFKNKFGRGFLDVADSLMLDLL